MNLSAPTGHVDASLGISIWGSVRRIWRVIWASIDLVLGLLLSLLVLVTSIFTTELAATRFGFYSDNGVEYPWMLFAWILFVIFASGCYTFQFLLGRSWCRMLIVAIICGLGFFAYDQWLLAALLPAILLLGAFASAAIAQRWQRSHIHAVLQRNVLLKFVGKLFRLAIETTNVVVPLACLFLLSHVTSLKAKREFESQTVPDLVFETAAGDSWRLSDHSQGKVVVIDFWATWCGPCRAMMPKMRELYENYADREDFLLLGVAEESDRQGVISFCAENNLLWQQLFLPEEPLAEGVHPATLTHLGIPSIWVIDRDGTIVGADLRGKAVRETIEQAIHSK